MLPKTRRPTELSKDRPDQIVFGLAFIGRTGDGEDIENVPCGRFEGVELTIVDHLPVGRSDDRFANKIIGEKTSMERIIDTHTGAVILITLILPHLPHSPKGDAVQFAAATSICLSTVTIRSGLYLRIGICLVLLHYDPLSLQLVQISPAGSNLDMGPYYEWLGNQRELQLGTEIRHQHGNGPLQTPHGGLKHPK